MAQNRDFVSDVMQVNTATAGDQTLGGMARLAGGGYLVVWATPDPAGGGELLLARIIADNGTPSGTSFLLAGGAGQSFADLAVRGLLDGSFVVAWADAGDDGSEVHGQRFSASGAPLGPAFQANSETAWDQYAPTVAALPDGGYVMAWAGTDADWSGVRFQRFTASGEPVGTEKVANEIQSEDQYDPAIAALAGGGFVIVWTAWGQDGDGDGIFARVFGSDGSPVGPDIAVNQVTAADQYAPAIAALDDGGFVIAWTSWGEDGDGEGIFARRFDASGTPKGDAFPAGSAGAGDQFQPFVTALADSSFAIGWVSTNGGLANVSARFFGADGQPAGDPVIISGAGSAAAKISPVALALDGGALAFAWAEWGLDGSGWGIASRETRALPAAPPVFSGPDQPLTAGLEDHAYTIRAEALLAGWTSGSGEALSLRGLSVSQGSLADNGNGTWTLSLPEDFHGTVDLTYDVAAGAGLSTPATKALAIAPVNDAPRLVEPQVEPGAASEDTAFVVSVAELLLGFEDVEGQELAVSNLSADRGTVTAGPDGSFLVTPQRDFAGDLVLSYRVVDPEGASAAANRIIAVSPVNDAPVLAGQPASLPGGTEDIAYFVRASDLLAGHVDPDGDSMRIVGLTADNGTVIAAGDTGFTIVPNAHFNGVMTLGYRVADSSGASRAATLSYEVAAVADGPTAIAMSGGMVREMAPRGTVVATFAAPDPDGKPVTYSLVDNAAGRFAINGSTGVLTVQGDGLLDYEASQAHSVTVRVAGASGLAVTQVFAIRVGNVVEQQVRSLTSASDTFLAPSDDHWNVDAGSGNDLVTTGSGNDVLRGGGGNDSLSGGAGNDLFTFRGGSEGFDVIEGGAGFDEIQALSRNSVIGVAAVTGVEIISGNGFSGVRIAGSEGANRLDLSAVVLRWIEGIDGGGGNDTISGSTGHDTIRGGRGDDLLAGGLGNDTFVFRGWRDGFDAIDGGEGRDRIIAAEDRTVIGLSSVSAIEMISGNGQDDVWIRGDDRANRLDFSQVTLVDIDRIDGGRGDDTLTGSAGRDVISGGAGADVLRGGAGRDIFELRGIDHSRTTAPDLIMDFERGSDRIDLSRIDASTRWSGDQDFSFIGAAAFHRVAGELRLTFDSASQRTIIAGDVDGDGRADFAIHLAGHVPLTASDFYL